MAGNFSKFDSFLKRVLPNSEYKEVKAYEPCVISSSKRHAFRFTFITNEKIYVTENPPKSLLFHIHLQDVVSVEIIRDKALFLQADLQEHVQHIVIKYIKRNNATTSKSSSKIENVSRPAKRQSQTIGSDCISNTISDEDTPSTSSFNGLPMLCSLVDVRATDHKSDPDLQISNTAKAYFSQARTLRHMKMRGSSRKPISESWETRDPYFVDVAIADKMQEIDDLHLYILNEKATYHMMLNSVWRNYIVYGSFTRNRRFSNANENSSAQASYDQSKRVLFSELRQELLSTENVEQMYRLYYELKEAASHDILLKTLFWKDQTLFDKTTDVLSKYAKNSAQTLDVRSNEIDLLIIILQCLAIMLREVEAIPQCYQLLLKLSQSQLSHFINSILQKPTFYSDDWFLDKDVNTLLLERVTAASGVIYQLIIVSGQVQWIVGGESTVFNSAKLLKLISENSNLYKFLDNLLESCVFIWSKPTKQQSITNQSFNSEEAIDAFHMFTVLHRILAQSRTATQYARSSFQEEFRYYINPNSVAKRFPLFHPISSMARAVVHATGAIISRK